MAATVELQQLAEALRVLAEQQGHLQQLVGQMAQSSTVMMAEVARPKTHKAMWCDGSTYKNLKIFGGDAKDWEEFAVKLKGQIAADDLKVAEVLDYIEAKMSEDELEDDDFAQYVQVNDLDEQKVTEIANKMYNLLLNMTTAEANAMVRRCQKRNRLLAWKRLCANLNPRTLASGVKAISQVLNPAKIMDAKKADVAIDVWEDKIAKLSIEYGETVTHKVKVAVLYSMLPKDLQEKVLDKCAVSWDRAKEADAMTIFSKIKEEVKNIAKSRRDMSTPRPMEVDKVWAEQPWDDDYDEDQDEHHEDEGEVNYVGKGGHKGKGKGKGAAYSCGEMGRRAAECPNEGKGKGRQGKGKGGPKGGEPAKCQLEHRVDSEGMLWVWQHSPPAQGLPVEPGEGRPTGPRDYGR